MAAFGNGAARKQTDALSHSMNPKMETPVKNVVLKHGHGSSEDLGNTPSTSAHESPRSEYSPASDRHIAGVREAVQAARTVSRREKRGESRRDSRAKVFVGGVPQDMNEDTLKSIFSRFGQVSLAWFTSPRAEENNRPMKHRGFAFVVFQDESSVRDLLKNANSRYITLKGGKTLEVKRAIRSRDLLPPSSTRWAHHSSSAVSALQMPLATQPQMAEAAWMEPAETSTCTDVAWARWPEEIRCVPHLASSTPGARPTTFAVEPIGRCTSFSASAGVFASSADCPAPAPAPALDENELMGALLASIGFPSACAEVFAPALRPYLQDWTTPVDVFRVQLERALRDATPCTYEE